jgi:hypothetical protein
MVENQQRVTAHFKASEFRGANIQIRFLIGELVEAEHALREHYRHDLDLFVAQVTLDVAEIMKFKECIKNEYIKKKNTCKSMNVIRFKESKSATKVFNSIIREQTRAYNLH